MKNHMILAAAAALALVACAKVETIQNDIEGNAISFGVYVPQAITKAGTPGTITTGGADETIAGTTTATTSLQTTGFGVFVTYSDGKDYEDYNPATDGPKANFMYNTKVSGASWTYSPLKYWPNETIDDNNNAHGPANADKLSFFAYAPYVSDDDSGSNVFTTVDEPGISALTTKTDTTDPKVTYKISQTPDTAVDLLWAVAPAGGLSYKDVHNFDVEVEAGMPLTNLTKPSTAQTIPFRFRHATSRLGLTIIGAFDQEDEGAAIAKEAATKVTVASVTLSMPAYTSANLNLNNTEANTPLWEGATGDASNTVFTVSSANLNATILDAAGTIPQTVEGVTATEKNLFVDAKTFFTLIPRDAETTIRVTITYYVTTADNGLAAGGSRVENVIYKDIKFGNASAVPAVPAFAAGTKNNIKIILGLTSVKLVASVEEWADCINQDVDLPKNFTPAP